MKRTILVCCFMSIASFACASVSAEDAYDIARKEMFPTDYNRTIEYSVIRNETPWDFNRSLKPEGFIQIENKLTGKDYWAVVIMISGKPFQFFIDRSSGEIIASYPSHEQILKYYSRGKGLITMDEAIAIGDKSLREHNIDSKNLTFKIRMLKISSENARDNANTFLGKRLQAYVCNNYSTVSQLRQLSEMLPNENQKPTWEIVYNPREKINERRVTVLIDAVTGKLLDFNEK